MIDIKVFKRKDKTKEELPSLKNYLMNFKSVSHLLRDKEKLPDIKVADRYLIFITPKNFYVLPMYC